METHIAYTDGASSGNPGPAGWCYELDGVLEWGTLDYATNNECEMLAILQVLMNCPTESKLIIHTDSKLMIGLLSKGWVSRKNPNLTEMQALFYDVSVLTSIIVEFVWIHGHSSNEIHNRVDSIARQMARFQRVQLQAIKLGV